MISYICLVLVVLNNKLHSGESDLEFVAHEEEFHDDEVIKIKPPTVAVVAAAASFQVWPPTSLEPPIQRPSHS
jgi:hypothetical protein